MPEDLPMRNTSPHVVGAFDAKNHLGRLLDQVASGDVIVITRHGKPVARLVPYDDGVDRGDARSAATELRAFRRGNALPRGLSVRDMIDEGRR